MSALDWVVLLGTLLLIVAYGTWKTRRDHTRENYLRGGNTDRWWVVGFSVVATQLSAVTFLSTPGQGYLDGMRFVQFYFGLPLAMIVICLVFIPLYYKWNVFTAYEFIGKRFGPRMRGFTAVLFLIQRSLAAGITIYAPSIILSKVLGVPFAWTFAISALVILYTTIGGAKAVSATQTQQMTVIFVGMLVVMALVVAQLGERMSFVESLHVAGAMGHMNVITTGFDPNDKYTLWSGLLGGFFLQLAYFGTDQSQVGRYLSGRNSRDAKLGLIFNALVKIPMQFLVLLTGVLVFVFHLFNASPVHWNAENLERLKTGVIGHNGDEAVAIEAMHAQNDVAITERSTALLEAIRAHNDAAVEVSTAELEVAMTRDGALRDELKALLPEGERRDDDHIFLSYAVANLPKGIIGLLLAVMLCASMSTTSAELNALASTTVLDVMKSDANGAGQVRATQWATLAYGGLAMLFAASVATWFGNLIQAVNEIGSLFYGTILGIFLVAFFLKRVHGSAVFLAAIISETVIISLYALQKMEVIGTIGFLWYNLIAPAIVVSLSLLFQAALPKRDGPEPEFIS